MQGTAQEVSRAGKAGQKADGKEEGMRVTSDTAACRGRLGVRRAGIATSPGGSRGRGTD